MHCQERGRGKTTKCAEISQREKRHDSQSYCKSKKPSMATCTLADQSAYNEATKAFTLSFTDS